MRQKLSELGALARYGRQMSVGNIGFEGQKRIASARVAVVGAGGLGSALLLYLAAAGVGSLGISDFDTIEESNLNRQVLYTEEDVGKRKDVCAKRRILALNPEVEVSLCGPVSKEGVAGALEPYDLVVDCTDSRECRYILNDYCVVRGVPFVCGSSLRWEGALYAFRGDCCYRCLYPQRGGEEPPTCAEVGVLGPVCGVVGSLMATEVLKEICGVGGKASSVVALDAFKGEWLSIDVRGRKRRCNLCTSRSIQTSGELRGRLGEGAQRPAAGRFPQREGSSKEAVAFSGNPAVLAKGGRGQGRRGDAHNVVCWERIVQGRERFLLVDIRTKDEHKFRSPKGSEAWSFSEVISDLQRAFHRFRKAEQKTGKKVVLVCRHGQSARRLAALLGVLYAEGGFESYRAQVEGEGL